MNTANSKTKHSKKFVYNFTDKLNLKNPNKNIALANLSIYYTWKNVKSDYNNNKFKISAPTWNDTFDVPDGSYSIAALLKSGYKLELLSKETMRLLGSSTDTIDGDKNSELVPKLESVDLVLVHCNLVNNSYQQDSKVLFTFVPNKKYGQLITVSPETLIMLITFNTEFSFIEIWFTNQDNRPLEIEHSVNISLIIGIGNFM